MFIGTFLPLLLFLNQMFHTASLTNVTFQCLTPTRPIPPRLLHQSSTQSRTLTLHKAFHWLFTTLHYHGLLLFVVGGWDLSWGYFTDRNLYRPGWPQTEHIAKDNKHSHGPASNSWMLGYHMWLTILIYTLWVFLHKVTPQKTDSCFWFVVNTLHHPLRYNFTSIKHTAKGHQTSPIIIILQQGTEAHTCNLSTRGKARGLTNIQVQHGPLCRLQASQGCMVRSNFKRKKKSTIIQSTLLPGPRNTFKQLGTDSIFPFHSWRKKD